MLVLKKNCAHMYQLTHGHTPIPPMHHRCICVCEKITHTKKHLVCLFPNVATPTFAICPKFDCFPLTHTHSLPYASRPFSPHTHVTETRCFFLGARRVGRRQGGAQRSEARAQPGKEAKKTHFFCLSLNVALPLLPYVQN